MSLDRDVLPLHAVLKLLQTSSEGLSDQEASVRLEKTGYNELKRAKGFSVWWVFLRQFKNTLVVLLIVAGVLSAFIGERVEAGAIFGILVLNALLGFVQEYRAEKAIEALQRLAAPMARVVRQGRQCFVPAREVVPGDVLVLEAGDIVAADARLLDVAFLQVDEASLTGESVPVKKRVGDQCRKQVSTVFMGTVVVYGKGTAVVLKTGMSTALGEIAASVQVTEDVQTPLQRKFTQLAKQIGGMSRLLLVVVFVVAYVQGITDVKMLVLFVLALLVAVVPESLPIIVTISLSLGARVLAKRNMLVKKLPAAEALGAVTIICSDKTGTITKNEMTITDVFCGGQKIHVTGAGYDPQGEFLFDARKEPRELSLLLRIGVFCNNARLVSENAKYTVLGDPTEGALLVLAKKGNTERTSNYQLLRELPFDSERKMMSVVVLDKNNKRCEAYVKGAPEKILRACNRIIEKGRVRVMTTREKERILQVNTEYARHALRVLALAYREVSVAKEYTHARVEKDLIFVGLVGMIDPAREGVKEAVQHCVDAGIKTMLITGDNAVTAQAVAVQVGLFKEGDRVITGDDVEQMSDEDLEHNIDQVRIFARALPIQKLRIVDALQKKGHVVAMTGDGVNDAPALKKADIGIAMGVTGTDIAKEVADAVLVDDNFASIVNAIREGRNIYDKIMTSAKYLLACNLGEVTAVLVALLFSFPLPILPLQLLLMNILTDNIPALGLGLEKSDDGVMKRSPRDPREKPISQSLLVSLAVFGLLMGVGTVFVFSQFVSGSIVKAQTIAFTTLVLFQMFAVLSSKSLFPSLKKLNPFSNLWLLSAVGISMAVQLSVVYLPPLQRIFDTVPLAKQDWLMILGVSFTGFIAMELSKFVSRVRPRLTRETI